MRNFEDLSPSTQRALLTDFVNGKVTFSQLEEVNNVQAESFKFALTDYIFEKWEEFKPAAPQPVKITPTLKDQALKVWQHFRASFAYDLIKTVALCGLLMFFFVNIPRWISQYLGIDPLSNIYISNGFTALYYVVFALLGISLILLFLDRKSYLYLNPSERTTPDYLSELFQAKPLLRCVLIPLKYYFYLLLFVLLLMYTGKGLVPE
ncbi:hypothetical protein [Runella sp.]|uniref:hypothetical protein n=1 Tax=Runella sp. TaxID=1960881 RepID=UPI003D0FE278